MINVGTLRKGTRLLFVLKSFTANVVICRHCVVESFSAMEFENPASRKSSRDFKLVSHVLENRHSAYAEASA